MIEHPVNRGAATFSGVSPVSTAASIHQATFSDIRTGSPAELQAIVQRGLRTNRQLIDSGRVKLA